MPGTRIFRWSAKAKKIRSKPLMTILKKSIGVETALFTYSLLVEGNDSKDKDATRFTNPHTSYRHNLMRFVIESREKGAYPSCSLPL